MNRQQHVMAAIIDLILLIIAFWCAWYMRSYLPPIIRGGFVVVSTGFVAFFIMRGRDIHWGDIGIFQRSINKTFIVESLRISFLIFLVMAIGAMIAGVLFGTTDSGSAFTNQPTTILGFLLDIIIMTWLVTGFGEEFLFRGVILHRLSTLFDNQDSRLHFFLVAGLQSIWFGAGHPSQGITGIVVTGLIGFALGLYFLKHRYAGLWPLVAAHAFVDTIGLSLNYFFR